MTFTSVAALRSRPYSRAQGLSAAAARERWVQRRVWATWALLVLNVSPYTRTLTILPIPSAMGKAVTQGSLVLALLLALTVNRKITVRPSIFMFLVSLLCLEAVLTALFTAYPVGTGYRTVRFLEFAAVMWLLTPFMGRKDMLLLRCHLKTMVAVLCTVVAGLLISPGKVLGNRMAGILWPVPGTQVAHYAAVTLGMVAVLWFCRRMGTRTALILGPMSVILLLLSHTRTALFAGLAGILIAALSLITRAPRVRKFFFVVIIVGGTAWLSASSTIHSWIARGQENEQLTSLSGRAAYWGPLLAYPRNRFQEIFGFGLQNGTFGGLPIDSNWLSSYEDQGLWGVTVCVLILLFLYVSATFAPRGPQRALALFFTTYCLVASYTEDGFTAPTPYLLDLFIAASLLIPFGMIRGSGAD
jgi:hypothetical protein